MCHTDTTYAAPDRSTCYNQDAKRAKNADSAHDQNNTIKEKTWKPCSRWKKAKHREEKAMREG